VVKFPALVTSHVACGFPALRTPAHFGSKFMRPIEWRLLSKMDGEYDGSGSSCGKWPDL